MWTLTVQPSPSITVSSSPPAAAPPPMHRDNAALVVHLPMEGYSLYPSSWSNNCESRVTSPFRAREYVRSTGAYELKSTKSSTSSSSGMERSHDDTSPLVRRNVATLSVARRAFVRRFARASEWDDDGGGGDDDGAGSSRCSGASWSTNVPIIVPNFLRNGTNAIFPSISTSLYTLKCA